jgi:two-component system, OmpR family, phosphate regulon sensor histidine kinase PhoR
MNKRTIIFIIVLTSISLTGIVVTQLFWVKNALKLQEDQFSHRVSIALKSVVTQLSESKADTTDDATMNGCNPGCEMNGEKVISKINEDHLDSLIKEEFANMSIHTDYEYAIFRKSDQRFVMGKYENHKEGIIHSKHFTSLSCLWKPESYFLSVYFPGETRFLIGQIFGWLSISAVFILNDPFFVILVLTHDKALV